MIAVILIIALIIETIVLIKSKLNLYVLAMWLTEKEYPLPQEQDAERLAKKITDKWFKRRY